VKRRVHEKFVCPACQKVKVKYLSYLCTGCDHEVCSACVVAYPHPYNTEETPTAKRKPVQFFCRRCRRPEHPSLLRRRNA